MISLIAAAPTIGGPTTSDILTVTAAVISAIIAVLALLQSRKEGRSRLAIEHLQSVLEDLVPVWPLDTAAIQKGVIDWYKSGGVRDLTKGELAYFKLLNSLDLMAFGAQHGTLDNGMIVKYIGTLIKPPTLELTFLKEIQAASKDDGVYAHLYTLYNHVLTDRAKSH